MDCYFFVHWPLLCDHANDVVQKVLNRSRDFLLWKTTMVDLVHKNISLSSTPLRSTVIMKLFLVIAALLAIFQNANAFTSPAVSSRVTASKSTELNLFGFLEQKDDGKPGDYLCPDCGYVFTKGPAAWAKLSVCWQNMWDYPCCWLLKLPCSFSHLSLHMTTEWLFLSTMWSPQIQIQEGSKGICLWQSGSQEELVLKLQYYAAIDSHMFGKLLTRRSKSLIPWTKIQSIYFAANSPWKFDAAFLLSENELSCLLWKQNHCHLRRTIK